MRKDHQPLGLGERKFRKADGRWLNGRHNIKHPDRLGYLKCHRLRQWTYPKRGDSRLLLALRPEA